MTQTQPRRGGGTFASLHSRNYRLFFFGQLVSVIGTWLHQVAETWLVYRITDSGIAVLVTDNYAVEHYHRDFTTAHVHGPCAAYPLHEHCLFKLGLPLGELWYLSDLADWLRARKRDKFFLTAPPLRLPGAVGSPATPVATV